MPEGPSPDRDQWPSLFAPHWRKTVDTLQRWTQLVGKTRPTLVPPSNHCWSCPVHLSARGLTTGPMPFRGEAIEAEFNFVEHRPRIRRSDGQTRAIRLEPRSVADFYEHYRAALESLEIDVPIHAVPNEVPDAIPFAEDHVHRHYDPDWANAFFRALLRASQVMNGFRAGFIGKVSPVHFFWGGFDLAVTRFSGRRAPPHPGGVPSLPDYVVQDAYSHEVSSAGFWPGSEPYLEPAFYSYAYPEPPGLADEQIRPSGAFYHPVLREFLLPYEAVRASRSPSLRVLEFFEDTYRAAAELGRWNRAELESERVDPITTKEQTMDESCDHLEQAAHREQQTVPRSQGCEDCLRIGSDWVHLRLCLECGHVGCCDSSPHRHATHHFHATGHPVIRSFEPGEAWGYCYRDRILVESLPGFADESALEHFAAP